VRNRLAVSLAVAVFILSACAEDRPIKDLFSVWNDVGTGLPLDLRGTAQGPATVPLFWIDGSQCDCRVSILGDQSSGSWVFNSCVYLEDSSLRDPGCNSLNTTGIYRKSDDQLELTDSSGNVFILR
jgi:hypothetical protein